MIRVLTCVLVLASAISTSAITIETVPVGNVGNARDPAFINDYGAVDHAYNIGKYEVTVGQYTVFLNAVAANDTYGLYHEGMTNDLTVAGVARNGVPGNYSYSVIGSPNHPITYVGWGDAARFTNWLHNGQPAGAQNANSTEDGAYRLLGAVTGVQLIGISRNSNAQWFLPSQDEWYKAAYHQPAAQGGDADSYWTYPMQTNSVPFSDQPPGAAPPNTQAGNFFGNDLAANGYNDGYAVTASPDYNISVNHLTDVGAYSSSPSFYGTFDQGGSVWEWNEREAVVRQMSSRGIRGGSWTNGSMFLTARTGSSSASTNEGAGIGFRVATVPEPSAAMLLCVGVCLTMCGRRRCATNKRAV